MKEAKVTSKGQITIPKAVRERLRLEPGDSVLFDVRDYGAVVLVARNEPIESLFGCLQSRGKRRAIRVQDMNPATLDE
jgi:antitoxin PrlF